MRKIMISKIPHWFEWLLLKTYLFKFSGSEKILYLTFDDGPVPEVTPQVLELLKRYNAKATFFCVGDNVEKHNDIYNNILSNGHSVGNHTFSHIKGWNCSNRKYFKDVKKASKIISSCLFRPPYARISPRQAHFLKQQYRIILWSVISYDYNRHLKRERVWQNVQSSVTNNDIILFHDSIKAKENMLYALEKTLSVFSKTGYRFCAIPMR